MKRGLDVRLGAEMPTWTIIGAGYTGARLAVLLRERGAQVVVTRRTLESARAVAELAGGARAVAVNLERPETIDGALTDGGIVVCSVPPRESVAGELALVEACNRAGVRRLVYLGSTGVYGPGLGDWITEEAQPAPVTERGKRRLTAESAASSAAGRTGLSFVSLRIAGIYGPHRGIHRRLLRGNYTLAQTREGAVSRIHVDDLTAAIALIGTIESLSFEHVNVADDVPAPSYEVAEEVARLLGLNLSEIATPPTPEGETFGANRRISNQRLKALGGELQYPSWRQGVIAAMREDGTLASTSRPADE